MKILRCSQCGNRIPSSSKKLLCEKCSDTILLDDVKEYIRTCNRQGVPVHEHDVAKIFEIPRGKVKQWINEGRITYCDDGRI